MPTVNKVSLQKSVAEHKETFERLKSEGAVGPEVAALIGSMGNPTDLLVTVLIEKTTPKTPKNSGLPPSSGVGADETQTPARGGSGGKPRPKSGEAAPEGPQCDNLRTTVNTRTVPVDECGKCGRDLAGTPCDGTERRVKVDIVFETVEERVDAESKTCPHCRHRTKGRFPDGMHGPLQYGPGIKAFAVNLLCTHMVSLGRTAGLIQEMTGRRPSESTLLGYVRQVHRMLKDWENAAAGRLLAMPTRPRCAWTGRTTGSMSVPAGT